MRKKINNSLEDENIDIDSFISNITKNLNYKRKITTYLWTFFSIFIAMINISILLVSSIALNKVIVQYNTDKSIDFISEVLPTTLVSLVSILLFILSILISIYQGKMKSSQYKIGMQDIQYLLVDFNHNKNMTEKEFKKKVNEIYKKIMQEKNSKSIKHSMVKILTGGDDE